MHDKKISGFRNMNAKVKNTLINIGVKLKQRYKFILNKLFIVFICLFIVLCGQVVVTLLQDWKEFRSPYPIMVEYYRIRYFGSYRAWMINYGCSEHNVLFKLLEKQQKKDLECIKSIIPKDDLLIDLLEWQIKFEPYFMYANVSSKMEGLAGWLINMRFKKSHIKQIEDQEKFIWFHNGIWAILANDYIGDIDGLNTYEEFVKAVFPEIKKDNYFAKIVLQPFFVFIAEKRIAINNEDGETYTEKTCTNPYYPVLIKQLHEWRSYIDKLSGLTEREKRIIKTDIKRYNYKAKEIYEFNRKYCLKK